MHHKRIPAITQFSDVRTLVTVVLVVLLLVGAVLVKNATVLRDAKKDAVTWDAVFSRIQHDWPEVPQISTDELARRIATRSEVDAPFLLDVRTREES
jgi:hypothetical protein